MAVKKQKQTVSRSDILDTKGMKVLGWMIYSRTSKFSIPFDEFSDMLASVGISKDMAKQTNMKNAAIRTMHKLKKENKLDIYHRQEQEGETVFVAAKAEINESNTRASLSNQHVTSWDKDKHEFKGNPELTEQAAKQKGFYEDDQFRTVVKRYLQRECSALTVLDTGGLYFVPYTKEKELGKLTDLFAKLGQGCTITPIPIMDSKQSKSAMWNTMIEEVNQDIANFKKDLSEQEEEITERSLEVRLKKYKTLKVRIEMFESVLSGTAVQLKEELDTMTQLIRKKILI